MFYLKKLLAPLFFPVSGGMVLLLLGLHALWVTRRPTRGRLLVSAGTALLLVFGYPGPAKWLVRSFERVLPALDTASTPAPAGIVVLGGGYAAGAEAWPVNARIRQGFLPRLVEGVRLARAYPDTTLVISLGAGYDDSERQTFANGFARLMALDRTRVLMLGEARDTGEEAAEVARLAGGGPVALVTSASHMPRAMADFAAAGVSALAAPCDPLALPEGHFGPRDIWPSAANLEIAERGATERVGRLWGRLTRRKEPASPER